MREVFNKLDLDLSLEIIGEVHCSPRVDVEDGEAYRPLSTLSVFLPPRGGGTTDTGPIFEKEVFGPLDTNLNIGEALEAGRARDGDKIKCRIYVDVENCFLQLAVSEGIA